MRILSSFYTGGLSGLSISRYRPRKFWTVLSCVSEGLKYLLPGCAEHSQIQPISCSELKQHLNLRSWNFQYETLTSFRNRIRPKCRSDTQHSSSNVVKSKENWFLSGKRLVKFSEDEYWSNIWKYVKEFINKRNGETTECETLYPVNYMPSGLKI